MATLKGKTPTGFCMSACHKALHPEMFLFFVLSFYVAFLHLEVMFSISYGRISLQMFIYMFSTTVRSGPKC